MKAPQILTQTPQIRSSPQQREELYLQGYGRQFGEKMTYSVGLTYGLGLGVGGTFGLLKGLQRGGATPKLFLNSVLNSMSQHGPFMANQCAVITLFYTGFNNFFGFVRGEDDSLNAASAGCIAGGLYKVTSRSWQTAAKYSAVSTVFFTSVDYGMKNGYI